MKNFIKNFGNIILVAFLFVSYTGNAQCVQDSMTNVNLTYHPNGLAEETALLTGTILTQPECGIYQFEGCVDSIYTYGGEVTCEYWLNPATGIWEVYGATIGTTSFPDACYSVELSTDNVDVICFDADLDIFIPSTEPCFTNPTDISITGLSLAQLNESSDPYNTVFDACLIYNQFGQPYAYYSPVGGTIPTWINECTGIPFEYSQVVASDWSTVTITYFGISTNPCTGQEEQYTVGTMTFVMTSTFIHPNLDIVYECGAIPYLCIVTCDPITVTNVVPDTYILVSETDTTKTFTLTLGNYSGTYTFAYNTEDCVDCTVDLPCEGLFDENNSATYTVPGDGGTIISSHYREYYNELFACEETGETNGFVYDFLTNAGEFVGVSLSYMANNSTYTINLLTDSTAILLSPIDPATGFNAYELFDGTVVTSCNQPTIDVCKVIIDSIGLAPMVATDSIQIDSVTQYLTFSMPGFCDITMTWIKSCDDCEGIGDSDGDGFCDDVDCDPFDSDLTVDTDGDGICDPLDCEPLDPDLPTTPGTGCDDGDPNTEDDIILSNGCTCAGTPIDPCEDNIAPIVTVSYDDITIDPCTGPYVIEPSFEDPDGNIETVVSDTSQVDINILLYTWTATDNCGAVTSDSVLVTINNPTILVTTITDATCGNDDGSAVIEVTPPGTYTYTLNGQPYVGDFTNLPAGTYTVQLYGDCLLDGISFTILGAQAPEISPTIDTNNCTGEYSVVFEDTSEIDTVLWNTGETVTSLFGLTQDMSVTVTFVNGCDEVFDFVYTPIDSITAILSTDTRLTVGCNGESNGFISVLADGGNGNYTYAWNTGDDTSYLQDVEPGTYEVTITDGNGCSTILDGIVVTEPEALNATTLVTQAVCATDVPGENPRQGQIDLELEGGVAPYTYEWSDGSTGNSLTKIDEGFYSVTITDANKCEFIIRDIEVGCIGCKLRPTIVRLGESWYIDANWGDGSNFTADIRVSSQNGRSIRGSQTTAEVVDGKLENFEISAPESSGLYFIILTGHPGGKGFVKRGIVSN